MIKALFGITQEPFSRKVSTLLPQQQSMMDMIKVHASQGGFSVIVGEPGVGKSVLREHIEKLDKEREYVVATCTRTLHTRLRAPTFGTRKLFDSWLNHLKSNRLRNSWKKN